MRKKLLYFCSFVPYNHLSLAGFEMISIFDIIPGGLNNYQLSGNLCSFIKNCESINFLEYDGIIFTNCCNSTQRLYEYVTYNYPSTFTYMIDLPHFIEDITYFYYFFFQTLRKHFHIPFYEIDYDVHDIFAKNEKESILVISSSIHKSYTKELSQIFKDYQIKFETCWNSPRGDLILKGIKEVSCPRMINYITYLNESVNQTKAVVFIIMQKCDQIMFTYPLIHKLCENNQRKILLIEEEYTEEVSERSKIRYEAFKECLELDRKVVKEKINFLL